jgi:hypothetical protein
VNEVRGGERSTANIAKLRELLRNRNGPPIKQSEVFFESATKANSAGKLALKRLLSEYLD